jgi:hypothetical protein
VSRDRAWAVLVVVALSLVSQTARAQDIEPRMYSNAPVGVNFLITGYAATEGAVPFDSSIPITDANLHTDNAVFAYVRAFGLGGLSSKFDVIGSYVWLHGSGLYQGDPVRRDVEGLGDARVRLSVNLLGAPALGLKEFARYRQDLIVGASVAVWAPVGQYDPARLVNISSHRWSIKPEAGVSKTLGRWTVEGAVAATFYTDNPDFYNGNKRTQEPLYSTQAHVIYGFRSGLWGSVDATYYTGGRSTLNGELKADLQQNWRLGATLAFPVNRSNSVKLYASSGVESRTGNDYDLLGAAWQYRWGGGL